MHAIRLIRARRRVITLAAALLLALAAGYSIPDAQVPAKKPLAIDDYTKWRSVASQEISGDGKWVTYTVQTTNVIAAESKPVLHILNLETNEDVTVADASGGTFSADSKWIAYQVDPGAAQRARAGRSAQGGGANAPGAPPADPANPPSAPPATPPPSTPPSTPPATPPAPGQPGVAPAPQTPPAQPAATGTGRGGIAPVIPPRRVELRNLATGTIQSWQEIGTFAFSPASTHLYLKRRGPDTPGGNTGGRGGAPGAPGGAPAAGGAAATPPAGPRGLDVVLVDLRNGRHQLLGSVGDIAFNRTGTLLAYTVDAAIKDSNGTFVFDAASGRITPLDNDSKVYHRLAWNDGGNAIAVLKGTEVDKMREKSNVLLAFAEVPSALEPGGAAATPVVLDPAKTENFPKGWVISDRTPMTWSDDNRRVFFGIKEQVPAPDATRKTTDEAADVDVWNTGDERIQSAQMIRAEQDRDFTFRQAFDLPAKHFVRLTDQTMREIEIAPDGRWAVGRDIRGYISDHKRAAADLYRVNTTTGERTLMLKNQMTNTSTGSHVFGINPHGTLFLYWKDNKYQAYDLDAGTSRTLASNVSFIDVDFDHPGPKPSFGVAGYASDGKGVVAEHQYDLYLVPFDGSAATNLTKGVGTKNEIHFRLIRTEPVDLTLPRATGPRGTFNLAGPLTLAAYGEWTKKAGFYELANGNLKELVYEDAAFSNPVKAAKADKYIFRRETFVEFPDLRVSGAGFAGAKKISDINPQQKDYHWGRRVLFDFKNKEGRRLQGILALPDDYKPGEKRPMMVTFYEKNSQNMHRYNAPSYLTGMGGSPIQAVSNGYITMLPDVFFHTGMSHSDMLDCVEAATRKVIELGYADPKRISVNGHSYGGEGAAFIGVMSKMFAAVGMGAGVTDLYNDFSQNWGWAYQYSGGSGANGNDYYLYGQGRWGFSPWEQPERYRFESALTHVPKATTPFLIMHGTSDPTVDFNNGLGFYNALRYNGKKAVLLAYPGEGHGLRGMANRKDLTIRFFEFFDHYLKGAPEAKWMKDGVPYLKKDTTGG